MMKEVGRIIVHHQNRSSTGGLVVVLCMIKSTYLDTSVFGGYFDEEFSSDTIPFFKRIIEAQTTVMVSELLKEELSNAPYFVKKLFLATLERKVQYISITKEVERLAEIYINERVASQSSFADCVHIALATANKADVLASWNLKHIVNMDRIKGYNAINLRCGYPILAIKTPREILKHEH